MRRFAILGVVLLFALVGAATLGLSLVTSEEEGQANATVGTFEPHVAVGNESTSTWSGNGDGNVSGDGTGNADGTDEGSGEVVTCNDQGPMPGNAGLTGRFEIERPLRDDGPQAATYDVAVTVGDGALAETYNATLEPGGSEQFLLFRVADQPDSLSGGSTTTVRARVVTNGTTVATASRTVDVVERSVPCADERGN